MKRIGIVLVVLVCSSLAVIAQKGEDYVVDKQGSFLDRVYFGGGMGLSGGSNSTSISISPIVGYMVSNRLSVGVGATYQFYKYTQGNLDFTDNRYGGSVFGRMNLFKQIFAYGEYSFLNYQYGSDTNDRRTVDRLPLGLGFSQRMGARSSFNIVAAYDMIYNELDQAYSSPWVISFYFAL